MGFKKDCLQVEVGVQQIKNIKFKQILGITNDEYEGLDIEKVIKGGVTVKKCDDKDECGGVKDGSDGVKNESGGVKEGSGCVKDIKDEIGGVKDGNVGVNARKDDVEKVNVGVKSVRGRVMDGRCREINVCVGKKDESGDAKGVSDVGRNTIIGDWKIVKRVGKNKTSPKRKLIPIERSNKSAILDEHRELEKECAPLVTATEESRKKQP